MTHSLGTLYLKVKTIQRHRVSWTFSKSFLLTITSIVYRVFPGFCCSIFDSIKFSLIFFLLGRAADVRATLETTLLALAKKKVKFYLILFQVDRRRKIKKKKRQKWKKKKEETGNDTRTMIITATIIIIIIIIIIIKWRRSMKVLFGRHLFLWFQPDDVKLNAIK